MPRIPETPPDPVPASPPRPRLAALDAARALGVVAMVVGHTLDAVLAPAARSSPGMVQYWHARGLTAPLFMLVSGWAVTLAIGRSGARGWAIPRGRLGRVALLFALGYLLRWPGWGFGRLVAGDREVWAHFLAFDALHCIAAALLVASLVLALPKRPIQAVLLVALSVAAVLGGRAAAQGAGSAGLPAGVPGIALAQVFGGTSPFPVLPWAAYFFSGTLAGLLVPADRRGALLLGAVGATLVAVTWHWHGVGDRPPGDPVLFCFRTGSVLTFLAGLGLVPSALSARAAPLGRSSLGVYALHLPIVYGWSSFPGLSWRVGPLLGAGGALGVALAVLLASYLAARALGALLRFAGRKARGL